MGEAVFSSDMAVELIKHAASGADVIWAARVPIGGEHSLEEINADAERSAWLIGYPGRAGLDNRSRRVLF